MGSEMCIRDSSRENVRPARSPEGCARLVKRLCTDNQQLEPNEAKNLTDDDALERMRARVAALLRCTLAYLASV